MNKNDLKFYTKLRQKKYRDSEKMFLIEGIHLIEECLKSKYFSDKLELVIFREGFETDTIKKKLRDIRIEEISDVNFRKLSETVNSQGIIGIVKMSCSTNQNEISDSEQNIIVALEDINDPGNLGTTIRTCYWFGVEEMLLSSNSVDMYNSKVIRASQGAIFNLIIKEDIKFTERLKTYIENGYEIIFTTIDSQNDLNENTFDKKKKYVIIFGNEANGISKKLKDQIAHKKLKIKSYSNCESLNLATSVGIVLYEAVK
jgi:RNA methyltransferase, TrmH family